MEQSITLERFDTLVVSPMTTEEAERAEYEIVTTGNRLRALVVSFYERRGWEALNYSSYTNWVHGVAPRLGYNPSRLFQELTAGLIEQALTIVSDSPIPESHLRPLAALKNDPDLMRDAWQEAHEIAAERGEKFTARHAEEAVKAVATPEPIAPMAVHFSSATPEHYTPLHILDMAREAMGAIDLDPASCVAANEHVQAAHWYGLDHPNEAQRNGLASSWFGRVWMNPPYGDEIGAWMARLVHQYDMENIMEAIALIPARTDTAWYQDAIKGRVVCFIRGRLKFGSAENSAPFPSALVYFGEDTEKFCQVFGCIGLIGVHTA